MKYPLSVRPFACLSVCLFVQSLSPEMPVETFWSFAPIYGLTQPKSNKAAFFENVFFEFFWEKGPITQNEPKIIFLKF